MKINTVVMNEEGFYVVNEKHCIPPLPDDPDFPITNRHTQEVKEWVAQGNEIAAYVGPTDMELWKDKMDRSDDPLPRWGEDLIDLTDGAISPQAQKLSDDKKSLRSEKP